VASDLLSKWLAWWQPLRGGLTLWGLANGLPLTNGWFWARVRGGYLLYRGCGSRDQIDWSRPAGAAAVDATVIREYGWMRQDQPGAPAPCGRIDDDLSAHPPLFPQPPLGGGQLLQNRRARRAADRGAPFHRAFEIEPFPHVRVKQV